MDLKSVEEALIAEGFEVYQSLSEEIQLAERVRVHMMDSSVRVRVNPSLSVGFIVRCQRSDFPQSTADELFAKVRNTVGPVAGARGYVESSHRVEQITDPVNPQSILDTWHEVSYRKQGLELEQLAEELRWAMNVEKFISKT